MTSIAKYDVEELLRAERDATFSPESRVHPRPMQSSLWHQSPDQSIFLPAQRLQDHADPEISGTAKVRCLTVRRLEQPNEQDKLSD
eukprot:2777145-Rhodomonas_salina.8